MSSTHSAQVRDEVPQLIHLPLWPYCFHAQGLFITFSGDDWNSSTFPPGSNFSP